MSASRSKAGKSMKHRQGDRQVKSSKGEVTIMMGKVKIKGQDHIRLGQYQGLGWDRNKPREG